MSYKDAREAEPDPLAELIEAKAKTRSNTPDTIAKLAEDRIKRLREEGTLGPYSLREWLFTLCALVLVILVVLVFAGVRSPVLDGVIFLASSGVIAIGLLEHKGRPPER